MNAALRREAAATRATALYDRVMALPRPADLSNNAWARQAGVNTSFFVNMRNGSEPSVGSLEAVLAVVGHSMSSSYAQLDEGRVVPPSLDRLAGALDVLLATMPEDTDKQSVWMAERVLAILAPTGNGSATKRN